MSELIVALDRDGISSALEVVDELGEAVGWYKVGSQLYCTEGPHAVRSLKERGKKVFLDLKYHDIPNTVANAVANAARMGVDMVNVHAQGGEEMMSRAVEAARAVSPSNPPLLIAVTVLTSMDDLQLRRTLGSVDERTAAEHVRHLARLARTSGMDGVVCSAHEISMLKELCGKDFKLVVPGIRPAGSSKGDQKRVMTPSGAAAAGADYIVVGRPVIDAPDPAEAARQILDELKA